MTTTTNNNGEGAGPDFGKRVLAAVPHLYPYLKHRLYVAEATGLIPRNMYKANGLLDDAILKLYEEAEALNSDDLKLKLRLFSLVDERLDELYEKESFHQNTLSTSDILKRELRSMEETFFMDADEDTLMGEDLDDISYHQDDFRKAVYLYDDAEKNIIQTLEVAGEGKRDLNQEERLVLHKIYTWLPRETTNILDLYIFGKMLPEEIAAIKNVTTAEVEELMLTVRKSFRKNLG